MYASQLDGVLLGGCGGGALCSLRRRTPSPAHLAPLPCPCMTPFSLPSCTTRAARGPPPTTLLTASHPPALQDLFRSALQHNQGSKGKVLAVRRLRDELAQRVEQQQPAGQPQPVPGSTTAGAAAAPGAGG